MEAAADARRSDTAADTAVPAPALADASIAPQTGPPEGFGAGVNGYLNHHVGVADAKAAGFLSAALALAAAVVRMRPASTASLVLWGMSVGAFAAAVVSGAVVLFPRLPKAQRRGLIFWEEIRIWPNQADYEHALTSLTSQELEFEYAAQNHTISGILHKKHVWVRIAIALFLIGAALGLSAYLLNRYA